MLKTINGGSYIHAGKRPSDTHRGHFVDIDETPILDVDHSVSRSAR